MDYIKFRIVKKNHNYAIQGLRRGVERIGFYQNRLGRKDWAIIDESKNNQWEFLSTEPKCTGLYAYPVTPSIYYALQEAQTALKNWLWQNLVEPTSQDKIAKQWDQVDKE